MKKIIAVLLVLAFAFSLVSCGSDDDIRGTVSTAPGGETSAISGDDSAELSLGTSANNTYENKFLGIGCKLDSDWTFYTDDEILEMNNIMKDAVGEEYAEAIENAEIIYDMYALTSDSLKTVNVNIQNLGLIYGKVLDEDAYIDAALDSTKGALESMGMENVAMKKTTVTFAGETHGAIAIAGEISGIKLYEKLVCIKVGKYMANITVASYIDDSTDEVLSAFYAL